MFSGIIRQFKIFRNKVRYKNSPTAIKSAILEIINRNLFKCTHNLLRELDDFEGIIDYNCDAKGNFECVLASGTKIKVTTDLTTVEL